MQQQQQEFNHQSYVAASEEAERIHIANLESLSQIIDISAELIAQQNAETQLALSQQMSSQGQQQEELNVENSVHLQQEAPRADNNRLSTQIQVVQEQNSPLHRRQIPPKSSWKLCRNRLIDFAGNYHKYLLCLPILLFILLGVMCYLKLVSIQLYTCLTLALIIITQVLRYAYEKRRRHLRLKLTHRRQRTDASAHLNPNSPNLLEQGIQDIAANPQRSENNQQEGRRRSLRTQQNRVRTVVDSRRHSSGNTTRQVFRSNQRFYTFLRALQRQGDNHQQQQQIEAGPHNHHHHHHHSTEVENEPERNNLNSVQSPVAVSRSLSSSVVQQQQEAQDALVRVIHELLMHELNALPSASHLADDTSAQNQYELAVQNFVSSQSLEQGYSLQEISTLPACAYSESQQKSNFEKICTICLLNFEVGEVVKTVACFHRFHSDCIDKWLVQNRDCPICRSKAMAQIDVE